MQFSLNKLKSYRKHPYIQQLKDVRVVGLIIFGVIVLLVSWSGLGAIQTNYQLQKQIARLEEQNKVRELENNNLKLKNQYYNTDQYLELQARRQFGKAEPGESLVLVPEHVALSKVPELSEINNEEKTNQPTKPFYQRNFEAWMDFFLHRQPDAN